MSAVILDRDDTAEAHSNHYQYTRIVEISGRIVRAQIKRDFYVEYSLARVEVINDQKSWTHLADKPAANWWHNTQSPRRDLDAAAVLGPVAERLIRRAAAILAPPTTVSALPPRLLDAVSALLATTHGHDAERRIEPDEIAWATTHGGTLHIIEHPDGSVTFTKSHRDECPFVVNKGSQDCDDECYFDSPHQT